MDMEHVEEVMDVEKIVKGSGYISMEHFERFKQSCINGMTHFGDSFQVCLGMTLEKADLRNSIRILRYWHQECTQLSILWRSFKAREIAEAVETAVRLEINDQ